jgi:hypothetical protein
MKINAFTVGPLNYACIDDMYTQEEIALIGKELTFLEDHKESASQTNSANVKGVMLKSGSGVFVDNVFSNRNFSHILTLNRKLFSIPIVKELIVNNCFFEHIIRCNRDSTLINFYGNNESYDTHKDSAMLSAVTFFSIGTFTGGNFCFPEFDISIEPIPGRTVIFPGCVSHRADPIIAEPGNYRVTMAQFMNYSTT